MVWCWKRIFFGVWKGDVREGTPDFKSEEQVSNPESLSSCVTLRQIVPSLRALISSLNHEF